MALCRWLFFQSASSVVAERADAGVVVHVQCAQVKAKARLEMLNCDADQS